MLRALYKKNRSLIKAYLFAFEQRYPAVFYYSGFLFFLFFLPHRRAIDFSVMLANRGDLLLAKVLLIKTLLLRSGLVLDRTDLADELRKFLPCSILSRIQSIDNSQKDELAVYMQSLLVRAQFFWKFNLKQKVLEILEQYNSIPDREFSLSVDQFRVFSPENCMSGIEYNSITRGEQYRFALPKTVPEVKGVDQNLISVKVPDRGLYKISSCKVFPGYCLHKGDVFFSLEPANNPFTHSVAGNWNYIIGNRTNTNEVLTCFPKNLAARQLRNAILISGRCSKNYFHWLIEYLPRLIDVNGCEGYTLIVDKGMPSQMVQSLELINRQRLQVYFYGHDELLEIENLLFPTIPTFHPDNFDMPYWQGSAVSKEHIEFIRNSVLSEIKVQDEQTTDVRKVFISRINNKNREIENQSVIEKVFQANGFEIVYPEKMSFLEQVALFNSAEVIVAATGAAMANLIFCKKGALIYNFIATHNRGYSIMSNLANSVGAEVRLVLGVSTAPLSFYTSLERRAHAPFFVPREQIAQLIDIIGRQDDEVADGVSFEG